MEMKTNVEFRVINRKIIAGILENMQEKMDMLLTGYLQEQRQFEKDDLEMMNDGINE